MQGDGWLFVGIIVFIFILWLATGGPAHPISWEGPYIAPLNGPGDVGEGYGEEDSLLSGYAHEYTGKDSGGDVTSLRETIAASQFGNASPFRGDVTIEHSVSALRAKDPDEEYISISVSTRADPVTLTGWQIQTNSGTTLSIPAGTVLPHAGTVNQTAPIVLNPGQEAVIVAGKSPIGVSFEENICTGYFDEYQSFTPPLSQYCPSPRSEYRFFYTGFDDRCEAYVDSLDTCSAARPSKSLSNECRSFSNAYLNYNGCVAAHVGDSDFYSDSWMIYLGSTKELFTKEHGSVRLLDPAGRTVDLLSY